MATNYPGGIDSFIDPQTPDLLSLAQVPHVVKHKNSADAIVAIEVALGINPQGSEADVASRISTRVKDTTLQGFTNQLAAGIDTFDRYMAITLALVSGTVYLTTFTPTKTITVSQISMGTYTPASAGLTLARMGLYTFDETTFTLVARTASDTTLFNSINTVYTRVFDTTGGYPSSYTLQAGVRYALGVICVGTTMPEVASSLGLNSTIISNLAPRMRQVQSGQTDLVTPITSFGPTTNIPWGRLS